jgi:hypothetical protein
MNAGVVFKDGSGARRVFKSSFLSVQEVWATWNVKRLRSPCSKHVRRSAFWGIGESGRNKLEKMACKGEPLSTLVKMGGRSVLLVGVVTITRFVAPGHEAPFSLPQSVAFAAGTIVHTVVQQLLPVGVVENDLREDGIARAIVPGLQASPIIPEMAPCNVSADLPIAACITYELPGSLLKLIWDEGVSALMVFRGSRFLLSPSWLPLLSYTTAWLE